ncbi:MAG: site-specific DNA-methyltransferase [Planctomycetes bacterium]|nr:site-specific DNA-methyltransferase [Planctomycetota bacterium]
MEVNKIYCGDNMEYLKTLSDNTIDLIVTSPNYNNWRNKRTQANRKLYWERTNITYDNCADKEDDETYEAKQVQIINEMIRILKPTGTICYNHKDRIFNFEVKSPLEWILKTNAKYRQRITWDRGGMQAYNPVRFYRVEEDIYILGKEAKNFTWNKEAAKYLSIWKIAPNRNIYKHNATFPEELVRRCVEAFTNKNDIVLDPYNGTGTTTKVAHDNGRKYIGIDNSERYCKIAEKRINENL